MQYRNGDGNHLPGAAVGMKVHFWGTRGSIPAALRAEFIRAKIKKALKQAIQSGLRDITRVEEFIDTELPFTVAGTYGTNTSCVEFRTFSKDFFICDAGTGIKDLGEYALRSGDSILGATYHLFISHLHWDHIQGFPFFSPAYLPNNTIYIYSAHQKTENIFKSQHEPPTFPLEFKNLGANIRFVALEPDKEYVIADVTVRLIEQMHPGVSYGYRFESNGKSLVYSTDSEHKLDVRAPDSSFLQFCKKCDLLIFDAQYGFAESQTLKENWGHSSNILGVELAKDAGVKHLCIFHHEPSLNDQELNEFYQDTLHYERIYQPKIPLQVTMSYDGLEVEL